MRLRCWYATCIPPFQAHLKISEDAESFISLIPSVSGQRYFRRPILLLPDVFWEERPLRVPPHQVIAMIAEIQALCCRTCTCVKSRYQWISKEVISDTYTRTKLRNAISIFSLFTSYLRLTPGASRHRYTIASIQEDSVCRTMLKCLFTGILSIDRRTKMTVK